MRNFIEDLDERYQAERRKNRIKKGNKHFVCNIPFKIELYGETNQNYIIRKGPLTRFLYVKDGCRVHFTDADILTMLLLIRKKSTMDLLIENLKEAYENCVEKYYIYIGKERYEVEGIAQIEDGQILTNPQDVNLSFNELLVLMNLILSKDISSAPLWPEKPDFFKHTVSKYISLISYYYYGDNKAEKYLRSMGFNVKADIYSNYDTTFKRDEKRGYFSDFEAFEKSGIL